MPLTESRIRECVHDDELFKLLSEELQWRLPGGEDDDLDVFLTRLRAMPAGLRAMAAMYQLDVSMALDDLGWHFANWHHRGYCDETLWALRELEASEAAEIFEQAYALVQPYWDKIGALLAEYGDFDDFAEWYWKSDLDKALLPLNKQMWKLCEGSDGKYEGLLRYWAPYARKYPYKVTQMAA
jgi:hypothetical protein